MQCPVCRSVPSSCLQEKYLSQYISFCLLLRILKTMQKINLRKNEDERQINLGASFNKRYLWHWVSQNFFVYLRTVLETNSLRSLEGAESFHYCLMLLFCLGCIYEVAAWDWRRVVHKHLLSLNETKSLNRIPGYLKELGDLISEPLSILL